LKTRRFGKTGRQVSEIGFGAWAIGASWGHVDESDALAALNQALDSGVTFIDTADVYGDGRSEQLIARVLAERGGERPYIATKAGRRLEKQTVAGYSKANLTGWVERSLGYLKTDALDLVQLHCPPTDLYYHQEVFGFLDDLKREGKIRDYGVSVERVEEALKAMEYPGVVSIQIIYNIFRQRPASLLFEQARKNDVAIIARVPLASGLLSGKFKRDTKFEESDHRQFNRHGEAFDVGETFSGVDYPTGVRAAAEFAAIAAEPGAFTADPGAAMTTAQAALRWVTQQPGVTTVIPGARDPGQARQNAAAAALPPLSEHALGQIGDLYDKYLRAEIHSRW
jgi:aryl-alcohol dehydrogenase-like predicted oxidoreductase